jgi:hypothetical protein
MKFEQGPGPLTSGSIRRDRAMPFCSETRNVPRQAGAIPPGGVGGLKDWEKHGEVETAKFGLDG